jgi:hypothetical protein
VDVPLEALTPFTRRQQDSHLSKLFWNSSVVSQVLTEALQPPRQLRASKRRHERTDHGAARAGDQLVDRQLLFRGQFRRRDWRETGAARHRRQLTAGP